MPTSLEHGPKYRCRKVNRGACTKYNRSKREKRKEGRGFKRVHNQMGEARPLNLLNMTAWLILTCLHRCPFCLRLGDHALALYVLAPCVYVQRQKQETSKQAMERKRCVDNVQRVQSKQAR